MSLQVPTKEIASFNPPAGRRSTAVSVVMALIVTVLVATLGGASWYYFFGRKPKIAMTVALELNGDTATRGLWSAGPDELLLVGDGDVRLIDLATRKKKWTATIPKSAPVDAAWQAGMNARFVKLQHWSDELSRKRAKLPGEAAIRDFNAEAAKYHAALTAARTEMANPKVTKPATVAAKSPAPASAAPVAAEKSKPEYVFGGDRSTVDALKPVADAGVRIVEDRMKKRSAKLQTWRATLDAKKTNAKTPLQKSAAADEEARYAAELAEQRKDEDFLKSPGEKLPAPNVAGGASVAFTRTIAGADESGGEMIPPEDNAESAKPLAAICADRIWIADGSHAVAFERSSGTVKADVRLAGPALQIFPDGAAVIVIASAGSDAVQIVKPGTDAQPQSSYFSTGHRLPAFTISEQSVEPIMQNLRTEFSAIGGSLLRLEIRLKEKRVSTRDAIKSGSEKGLESTAGGSAAHSTDELKAVTALLRNDSAKLRGEAIEYVDDSTYEITLKRPFEPQTAEWTGTLRGRVQVFSTPSLHLITAGTKLLAFDRTNQKLWEATLGGPVPIRRSESEAASLPWLESGGRLHFADSAFLSAIDAKSGQIAWRLPSVGIRKIQMDGEGNLYVQSDNLGVETLTYVSDASISASVPVTMQVNPADGKIRWQVDKFQDVWASGKDVYALREAKNPLGLPSALLDSRKVIETRVKIHKLSRGNGSTLWEWFQPRRPQAVEVQGKNVALLFGEELQVIRSICW